MAGIKIRWICLFAVAGFLLTSGEDTTTNTIQDQSSTSPHTTNSTEHIAEDALNASNSELNCTDKVSSPDEGATQENSSTIDSEIKEERSTEFSSSVTLDGSVSKENSTEKKEFVESNEVNEIKLDDKNGAEKLTHGKEYIHEKELESEATPNINESTARGSETDSSIHNSSADAEDSTTYTSSEVGEVDSHSNPTNESPTMTSSDVSMKDKSTVIKSTKKRSIDENRVDTTLPHTDNETEAETTQREVETTAVPVTEASSEVESENKNDESSLEGRNDTSSAKTDANDASDSSFDFKSAASVSTEAYDDRIISSDEESAKLLNVSRKRRLSTTGVDTNFTAPTAVASEETDSALDEPSSFDFPEHISVADTEIWPDNLPSETEWSSSHMSSSVSVSKGGNDPEQTTRDIGDPLQSSSSQSNPVTISRVSDTTVDLEPSIEPSHHKIERSTESSIRPSSEKVTQPHVQPSSIKTLKITGSDLTTPYKTLLIETSSMDASELVETSDNSNILTTSSQQKRDETSSVSSDNDSQILPVVQAALRTGMLLQPNVFSTHLAESSSEKNVNTESIGDTTGDPEVVPSSKVTTNSHIPVSLDIASARQMGIQNAEPELKSTEIHSASALFTTEVPRSTTSVSSNVKASTDKGMRRMDDIMLGDQQSLNSQHESGTPQKKTLISDISPKSTTIETQQKNDDSHVSAEVVFKSEATISNSPVGSDQNQQSVTASIKSDEANTPTLGDMRSNLVKGNTSSNKIVKPQSNPSDGSDPQTSSPAQAMSSLKPETSVQVETSTEDVNPGPASSPILLFNNDSIVTGDVNMTDIASPEVGNFSEVIADSNPAVTTLPSTAPPPPQASGSTTYRPRILKPKLKMHGSHSDSPRPTPRSIIPTHRPRATTTGEPVSIFNRKKNRIASITSSTTQRAISSFNIHNIHYADRVPDSMIPLAPGVALDVTPPPPTTTTEPPTTTTEEPYSEEPFTDPTQVPNVSNEDDVTLVKMAGTLVIKKGLRWNEQLYHRNSPHYKKISKQMHLRLERLFRTSAIATRLWSIEIDGFSETLPLTGHVMVDFILSLIKSVERHELDNFRNLTAVENEERRLAAIFNEKLINNTFGRYTVDPDHTEFKVLKEERRSRPTEAPGPEPPIPQWAIAVIVIGAASLIFIVLFATVTMYGRHHMRRRYSNKLSEEDIDRSGDWESKMASAYENLAADTIYDAEDGNIESMKRRQRTSQHARPNARLKRYDSWYSGNITVSPRPSYRQQVHRIVY